MSAAGRTPTPAPSPLLRRLLRGRQELDFSDYLELRRVLDEGAQDEAVDELRANLEEALPVDFADAIPHLVTLEDAPAPPPRGLTREALRVVFAMRQEFTSHGATRAAMMGFDLPDGEGLKDWLDFLETERKQTRAVRDLLRELDRKTWAVCTGDRRMPRTPRPGHL